MARRLGPVKRQSEMAAVLLAWSLLIEVGYGNGSSQIVVVPPFPTEAACKAAARKQVAEIKAQQAVDAARFAAENPNVDPGMSPPVYKCFQGKKQEKSQAAANGPSHSQPEAKTIAPSP